MFFCVERLGFIKNTKSAQHDHAIEKFHVHTYIQDAVLVGFTKRSSH